MVSRMAGTLVSLRSKTNAAKSSAFFAHWRGRRLVNKAYSMPGMIASFLRENNAANAAEPAMIECGHAQATRRYFAGGTRPGREPFTGAKAGDGRAGARRWPGSGQI